jgi:hypothetical protein
MPNPFSELPAAIFSDILLAATTDDLLRYVAVCAQVHPEWWRAVRACPAYGMQVQGRPAHRSYGSEGQHIPRGGGITPATTALQERARVLKLISCALVYFRDGNEADERTEENKIRGSDEESDEESDCWFDGQPPGCLEAGLGCIGDGGAEALGAALEAWPAPLRITQVDVSRCALTPAGLELIVAAMRRGSAQGPGILPSRLRIPNPNVAIDMNPRVHGGLVSLDVSGNQCLGDAGIVALARVLLPTLVSLNISCTRCRDGGMVAVAGVLPSLIRLEMFICMDNPVFLEGWVAIAAAVRDIPTLKLFNANSCHFEPVGAAALRSAEREGLHICKNDYSDIYPQHMSAYSNICPHWNICPNADGKMSQWWANEQDEVSAWLPV